MFKKLHLLLISFALILSCSHIAHADTEYAITNYSMDILIQPDGDAAVSETLVYKFDGEYNGILSLFDSDGLAGISDFRVFIDGEEMLLTDEMEYLPNTYTLSASGTLSEVKIYSPGKGDTRAVTYEYTMNGLAKRYSDAGMIYRTLIGRNNSVTLQNAVITINFPGNGSIESFVHGAMTSTDVTVMENTVSFGPKNIPSGKTVEIRLLFPPEWIHKAPLIDEAMYETALAEETQIAQEEALRAERTENAKYIFTAVYMVIFFAAWALTAKKYGLKGQLRKTPDPRRIPNYPAAFLTAALEDEADTDAMSGTLMELVADGSIHMEPEGEGLRFTRLRSDMTGYYPHQTALINCLFADRDCFLLSDLNAGSDYERAQAFERSYISYVNQVSLDMLASGLRFKNDGLRITLNALIILLGAMGTGGVLLAGKPNIPLGILLGGSIFLLLFLMSRIRRLTDEGEQLQMDASSFKNAGIASEAEYAEYIACYAALGMTEPLIAAMELRSSKDNETAFNNMPVWMYTGWYYSLRTLNSSLRDTHYHNASVPDPNASSSSGSHSGGSNGGGGGHGAW